MIQKLLWLVALSIATTPAFSQLLNWSFDTIINDQREGGSYPAAVLDPDQNLHVTFWNAERNRLMYGFRDRSTGVWTTEMVEDSAGGHVSALTLDAGLNVHVAFLAERGGKAYLRYARKSGGVWAIIENPSPRQDLGVYGPDLAVETNVHHSVDIQLAPDGEPVITYFDGSFGQMGFCNPGIAGNAHPLLFLPASYDFDANVTRRDPSGNWTVNNLDYPLKNPTNANDCRPISNTDDRFGEFGQLMSYKGKTNMVWVTNSFFNHQLLALSTETDSLERWTITVLDSASRILPPSRVWPEDGFSHIDAKVVDDSLLHVVYSFSQAYGKKLNTSLGRGNIRNLLFLEIPLRSLGDPSLPGLRRFEFVLPPRDPNFRAQASYAAVNSNVVFVAYHDAGDEVVVVSSSADGGRTWIPDTVLRDFQTNSPLSLNVASDSLYLFAYNDSREKLTLATRPIIGTGWTRTLLAINERRGTSLGAAVSEKGGNAQLYVATPEACEDRLEVAIKDGGTWNIEPVTAPGERGSDLNMAALQGDSAWLAFVEPATGKLRLTSRGSGTWTTTDITRSGRAAAPSLVAFGDSLWVAYTDVLAGGLRLAKSAIGSGSWLDTEVDNNSPRTGTKPVLKRAGDGSLHIAYRDDSRSVLRYANWTAASGWSFMDLTPDSVPRLIVGHDMEINPLNDEARVAYVDDITASVYYLEPNGQGAWDTDRIFLASGSQIGSPLDMIITEAGNPWVLFSYNVGGQDMRLVRLHAGNWQTVSLTGNSGEIAGLFRFLRQGRDLYIAGRKTRPGQEGLGLIYARNGASVSITPEEEGPGFKIYPNPATTELKLEWPGESEAVLELYSLTGKRLLQVQVPAGPNTVNVPVADLPAGMYVLKVLAGSRQVSQKVVIH